VVSLVGGEAECVDETYEISHEKEREKGKGGRKERTARFPSLSFSLSLSLSISLSLFFNQCDKSTKLIFIRLLSQLVLSFKTKKME
jgi:hypothetical protein